MKRFLSLTIILFYFLAASSALASTYYVTNNSQQNPGWGIGDDSNDGVSKETPFLTIQHAIGTETSQVMAGGDTLIIADGTYTRSDSNDKRYRIDKFSYLPWGNNGPDEIDGTADDIYTTIRAEHDGGVIIDGFGYELKGRETIDGQAPDDSYRYPNNYVCLRGLLFINAKTTALSVRNSKYVKIINCGATGSPDIHSGNSLMGMAYASYCLFEGCYAWGNTGYYVMQATHTDHCIWRNCVIRYDRSSSTDNAQCGALTNYSCANNEIQNCIVIDGDTGWEYMGDYTGTQGAFSNPGTSPRYDSTSYGPNRFNNCIALNNTQRFSTSDRGAGVGEHDGIPYDYRNFSQFTNCIGWDLSLPPGKSVRNIISREDLCYSNAEWNGLLETIRDTDENNFKARILRDLFVDKELLDELILGSVSQTYDGTIYTFSYDTWPTNIYARPFNEKMALIYLIRKIGTAFADSFELMRKDISFCEKDGFSDLDFSGADEANEKLNRLTAAGSITRNPDGSLTVTPGPSDVEVKHIQRYNLLALMSIYGQIHTLRPTALTGSEGWCSFNQSTFGEIAPYDDDALLHPDSGIFSGTGAYNEMVNCVIHNIDKGNMFRSFEILNTINITGFSSEYALIRKPATYGNIRVDTVTNLLDHPFTNQYLTLMEEDNPLNTAGNNNSRVGAHVLYQYGRSGTLWGQDGYDQLQDGKNGQGITRLWPFPNQDLIREKAQTFNYSDPAGILPPINGKRGFCQDGQTLTKYIWEYLGSSMPDLEDIYGTAPFLSADIDRDGDVDGSDLAAFAEGGTDITLEEFTRDFGKTGFRK
ncbi:MAG: right-handed parallel beta-helix repeat-containing protein [Desulfobacterium sp.]|nr:right-handed parallel beta-helix repeat-containing protein [Desulfobacterium sp.]